MELEKLLKVIDLILALQTWLEELHLTAKEYSLHLLAERLQDGFTNYKDEIREIIISLHDNSLPFADAKRNIKAAAEILSLIPDGEKTKLDYLDYTQQLYDKLLDTTARMAAPVPLRKVLDDLCAKLSRDIYLINQSIKGAEEDERARNEQATNA